MVRPIRRKNSKFSLPVYLWYSVSPSTELGSIPGTVWNHVRSRRRFTMLLPVYLWYSVLSSLTELGSIPETLWNHYRGVASGGIWVPQVFPFQRSNSQGCILSSLQKKARQCRRIAWEDCFNFNSIKKNIKKRYLFLKNMFKNVIFFWITRDLRKTLKNVENVTLFKNVLLTFFLPE